MNPFASADNSNVMTFERTLWWFRGPKDPTWIGGYDSRDDAVQGAMDIHGLTVEQAEVTVSFQASDAIRFTD